MSIYDDRAAALIGQHFTRLMVVEEVRSLRDGFHRYFCCRCDCGKLCIVTQAHLKSGHSRSCGCLALEMRRSLHITHGHTINYRQSPEWRSWNAMRRRCYDRSVVGFKNYGGRGIQVCPQWRISFEQFLRDVGPKPDATLTLDRINNDGDYEPGNVRWATRSQQNLNRRPRRRKPARTPASAA